MTDSEFPWPVGAQVQGIKFAPPTSGPRPLVELPPPIGRHALPVPVDDAEFQLWSIPSDHIDSLVAADSIKSWVSPGDGDRPGYQLISMQGVDIHWQLPRVAIAVPADRIDSVRQAVVESAYLEAELRGVEEGLISLWPAAEADAPLAFQFQQRDLVHRSQLAERFQQVVLLRSRLAKITPRLLVPQTYPPTLAGQVQERLRERLGVTHRIEAVEKQLDLFERIYDGCSQRSSEYVMTRKGLVLEAVIVLLLATQTLLLFFELLTRTTS